MGYFKETTTKKLTLPSDEKYWVEIVTDLKYGDIKKFAAGSVDGEIDFSAAADTFLQTVIKDWNLDDDQGNILPITPENIDRLDKDDAILIVNEAGGLVEGDAEKKTSSAK